LPQHGIPLRTINSLIVSSRTKIHVKHNKNNQLAYDVNILLRPFFGGGLAISSQRVYTVTQFTPGPSLRYCCCKFAGGGVGKRYIQIQKETLKPGECRHLHPHRRRSGISRDPKTQLFALPMAPESGTVLMKRLMLIWKEQKASLMVSSGSPRHGTILFRTLCGCYCIG
jgi:hypothetical protein